jgi:hypothetical protein
LTQRCKLLSADHGLHFFLVAFLDRLDQVVTSIGGVLESFPHFFLNSWAGDQRQPEYGHAERPPVPLEEQLAAATAARNWSLVAALSAKLAKLSTSDAG